ncbi:MAG: hypothetical protein ACYS8L_04940 [Planctomycetota bacterium]|jgi:hypothetical protein
MWKWAARVLGLACCLTVMAGCAAEPRADEASRLLEQEFRGGLLILDSYISSYERVGRRLVESPEDVSEQDRVEFISTGQAIKKMSRGLNVAVGNYEPPETKPPAD